jgi:acyl-CoA synthetase (AMP-forming)/AMP-acid ligase II
VTRWTPGGRGRDPLLVGPGGAPLLTYGQANDAAGALAAALRPLAGPGDVVSCVLPNGAGFVITLLATWRLGAVLAPLGTRLTGAEMGPLLERVRPAVLISTAELPNPSAAAARVVWEDAAGAPGWRLAGPGTRRPGAPAGALAPAPGDALVLFTSGSTGSPKGVLLTGANVEAGTASVSERCRLSAADRTVAALPWTHGHGLIGVLLSTLRSGGSVVLDPPGSAGHGLDAVLTAPGVTWVSLVPSLLATLCELAERRPRPRLRFVRTASAPLAPALAGRAEHLFGCPVAEAYGMTETAHEAAANEPDPATRRLGSVGAPSLLRFRTSGAPVAGGHLLEVAGPSVFRGYLGDEEGTRAALSGGWYRTQDIGTIGPDGRIRLLARASELINRAGNKISPVEIEEALSRHPEVAGSLATRVPDARMGDEVGVVIRCRNGSAMSAEDVVRHCGLLLAPYKVPRRIRFVDDIPRLPNGKPSRQLAMRLLLEDGLPADRA